MDTVRYRVEDVGTIIDSLDTLELKGLNNMNIVLGILKILRESTVEDENKEVSK